MKYVDNLQVILYLCNIRSMFLFSLINLTVITLCILWHGDRIHPQKFRRSDCSKIIYLQHAAEYEYTQCNNNVVFVCNFFDLSKHFIKASFKILK